MSKRSVGQQPITQQSYQQQQQQQQQHSQQQQYQQLQQQHFTKQTTAQQQQQQPQKPQAVLRLRPLSACNQEGNLLQRRVSRKSQQMNVLQQQPLQQHEQLLQQHLQQLQLQSQPSDNSAFHLTGISISDDTHTSNNNNNINNILNNNSSNIISTMNNAKLGNSSIYKFVDEKINNDVNNSRSSAPMVFNGNQCGHCGDGFRVNEPMVNLHGSVWHEQCFVCAQCFQPFPDGVFFEFEGRRYCSHDFQILFAPYCASCKEFILGRVIKAMNLNWHPHCFLCSQCSCLLADIGFVRNGNRALCRQCNDEEKARLIGKHVCFKCRSAVEEKDFLKFNGEIFHAYHYKCHDCACELTSTAREKDGELYCLRCHDKQGIPICAACRRPIEERAVHAIGKMWHVEHFVCCKCEKPFFGNRHYEKKGLAYCETHYYQAFGSTCFYCNSVITGDAFTALNKDWCEGHFACNFCDKRMNHKTKFIDFDGRPICKNCFKKFPSELVKRQKKACQIESKIVKK